MGSGAASLGVWSPTFRSSVMISKRREPSNAAQRANKMDNATVLLFC